MFYQMEGKLSALNFKARRKMSTLGKFCDFKHKLDKMNGEVK